MDGSRGGDKYGPHPRGNWRFSLSTLFVATTVWAALLSGANSSLEPLALLCKCALIAAIPILAAGVLASLIGLRLELPERERKSSGPQP